MSSPDAPEFFVPTRNDEEDRKWFHSKLGDAESRGGVVNRRIYRLDYQLGERKLRAEVGGEPSEVDGGETVRALIGAIFETPESYFIYGRLYGMRKVPCEDASEAAPFSARQ